MSEFAKIDTHVDDGLARLLSRWRGSPRMVTFVRIVLERVQHVENVLWDVYSKSGIDTAEGVQLDTLGAIVGEPRKGRQDTQYRTYVRARVLINRSKGKVFDTLAVARLIVEPTATITYDPEYPAAYRVTVANTAVPVADISAILNEVRPAGVQLTTVRVAETATAFTFNTSTPLTNGFNHGLMADGI